MAEQQIRTQRSNVYISYSWGDDTSDMGREREAIVDDLCRSFSECDVVIGRDKNDVKPGDSIEAYATRIAKAPLILAVISQRSLRSEWCMLHELFQAYRRRNYVASEFGSDVTALVLDDAREDVDKPKDLIRYWKDWCEEKKSLLQIADPQKTGSKNSWTVLENAQEMVRRLLDMLRSVKSIAMPRGSAEIRRDDFEAIRQRVLDRLAETGVAAQIPPPPARADGINFTTRLRELSEKYAGLSAGEVEASFRFAVQEVFPTMSLNAQFLGLADGAPIDWSRLLVYFGASGNSSHLDVDQLLRLLDVFQRDLQSPRPPRQRTQAGGRYAILSILVEKKGEELQSGLQIPYWCRAVLEVRDGSGTSRYVPIEPASNQIFCFSSTEGKPAWTKPGAVIAHFVVAALAELMELGSAGLEPMIDLYLPRALFDEDWSHVKVLDEEGEPIDLIERHRFRLRSRDRWINPTFLPYRDQFDAKHNALQENRGRWMRIDDTADPTNLISSVRDSRGEDTAVAIQRLTDIGTDQDERNKWYKAALASCAPLLLWWHHSSEESLEIRAERLKAFKLAGRQVLDGTGNRCVDPDLDLTALARRRSELPSSLVVVLEDRPEMDHDQPYMPKVFLVADALPSLGYGTG